MCKRAVALTLTLLLLLGLSGCGNAPQIGASLSRATPSPAAPNTPVPLPVQDHPGVRFSDMRYARPDVSKIEDALSRVTAGLEAGDSLDALFSQYDEALSLFNAAESQMSLAYLLYALDVTKPEYEAEYTYLQTELNRIDLAMTDASVALFSASDEAGRRAETELGTGYVQTVYEEESLNSEEIQPLLSEEQALVTQYDRLSATFSIEFEGARYTYSDIAESDIEDVDAYYRLYDAYTAAFNAEAGALYQKLLSLRARIAQSLGYGSYAAYMYDCYGRDFTLTDAQTLHAAVKRYIVPTYLAAFGLSSTETAAMQSSASENEKPTLFEKLKAIVEVVAYFIGGGESRDLGAYELSQATYAQDEFLEALKRASADFSPSLYASLDYMLRNGLYDFAVNPNKMSGSFTTYIAEYEAPFLFTQWTNDAASVGTVIHELGHFTNYYHNPSIGWSAGDCLDLAEVDSQALELLMTPYFPSFYGELAPYAERELLIDGMYALIAGCMEDEFQQLVYASPDMTLDEINALYLRLAGEYGFTALYGYSGMEWAMITHTFQSPMYYISYAASMVPALQLWELSQTDVTAARTAYFRILDREPYAAFRDVLAQNGLPDVFDEKTIADIGKLIDERVN